MGRALKLQSGRYKLINEFSGLQSVFPIDTAVFCGDELVAFIEIDGITHEKHTDERLGRKDMLKEKLYSLKYPNVPLLRISTAHIDVVGYKRAGETLANDVLNISKQRGIFQNRYPLPL